MFEKICKSIREVVQIECDRVPLHEPVFFGNEKKYLNECIDSTYVSSIGKFVDEVEKKICKYTGSRFAIATVNGTSALHVALLVSGVKSGDEVITQPLTFVATCNAISYCGAKPVFVDVDKDTMGLSPSALRDFLKNNAKIVNGLCVNKHTGNCIKACIPMHTFGHPCRIKEISFICKKWNISLVEDAAESLGSTYEGRHTGNFGNVGIFSFNGNKIVTAGGGGCIVTDNEQVATRAKHITTTAKVPNKMGEFYHDEIGYNYRMPNVNAAILTAQLENVSVIIEKKRQLAADYLKKLKSIDAVFVKEPERCLSNYWLNTIILENKQQKIGFLKYAINNGIEVRPCWTLMNKMKIYQNCFSGKLPNSVWLSDRLVNIPSTVSL